MYGDADAIKNLEATSAVEADNGWRQSTNLLQFLIEERKELRPEIGVIHTPSRCHSS